MKFILKRIGAYILDMFLVTLVASLIGSLTFINEDYKKYNELYSEYDEEYNNYQAIIKNLNSYYEDEKIDEEEYSSIVENYPDFSNYIANRYEDLEIDSDEYEAILLDLNDFYKNEFISYNYRLSKLNVISSIILIICLVVYYVVVQYLLGGQTLGKRIFDLKVVKKDDSKVGIINLLVRTLILTGILISIVQLVCLFILNDFDYYKASYYIQFISYGVEMVIMIMVLLRSDYRGLHDIIAGTKVVQNSNEIVNNNKVIEADYTENNK